MNYVTFEGTIIIIIYYTLLYYFFQVVNISYHRIAFVKIATTLDIN